MIIRGANSVHQHHASRCYHYSGAPFDNLMRSLKTLETNSPVEELQRVLAEPQRDVICSRKKQEFYNPRHFFQKNNSPITHFFCKHNGTVWPILSSNQSINQ